MAINLQNFDDALDLLKKLGASLWLQRHHELVAEAAEQLMSEFEAVFGPLADKRTVLIGAALHDAGKIVHEAETREPGCLHEPAGRILLVASGVSPDLARFCETHASWDGEWRTLEDLLVACADKVWKGARVAALEERLRQALERRTGLAPWDVFARLDRILATVAESAEDRLRRSRVS